MASAVIIGLGIILGFRPDGGVIGVLLAVALLLVFAFSLSWVWTAVGLKMPTPEAVLQISMTILFPLTFASNVFVDPETMPGWVQVFVNNNPITHLPPLLAASCTAPRLARKSCGCCCGASGGAGRSVRSPRLSLGCACTPASADSQRSRGRGPRGPSIP